MTISFRSDGFEVGLNSLIEHISDPFGVQIKTIDGKYCLYY